MVHGEKLDDNSIPLGNVGGSKSLPEKIALDTRPLLAFRDYHGTTHENTALNNRLLRLCLDWRVSLPIPALPSLHLAHNAGQLESSNASWYRNFEYEAERARGLDFHGKTFQTLASCALICVPEQVR